MPGWIEDVQGVTTLIDSSDVATQRRSSLKIIGATLADDGTKTVLTITGGGSTSGRLLRAPQVLTSGTTINHPAGTALIKIRGVGAGGAGGGVDAVAGSLGSNGASGTYGEKTFVASSLTSTYTIGVAGTGVSGAAGNPGTASTFTHGAVTVTLPPGSGGLFLTGGTTVAARAGGTAGGAATNADVSVPGQDGGITVRGIAGATHAWNVSAPGNTPLGNGPSAIATVTSRTGPVAATGFGAGGGGVLNGSTATAAAGASGSPGVWIVEEYS
jgi:hypothetical protein